jgi:hypothetical protein
MLEVDINRKTSVGVKLGTINFVQPSSLLTWMEIKRMIFDVGKRFAIRLEGDIVAFSIIFIVEIGIILLKLNDILGLDPLFSDYHYYLLGFHTATIGLFNIRTLWVAANINEEAMESMEKLDLLRHLTQRMIHDERIL